VCYVTTNFSKKKKNLNDHTVKKLQFFKIIYKKKKKKTNERKTRPSNLGSKGSKFWQYDVPSIYLLSLLRQSIVIFAIQALQLLLLDVDRGVVSHLRGGQQVLVHKRCN